MHLGSHPRYRHPPHLPHMSSKSTNSALRKLLPLPGIPCSVIPCGKQETLSKCFEVIWEKPDTLFFPSGRGECNWERKQGLAPSLWGLNKWVKCTAFAVFFWKFVFLSFTLPWDTGPPHCKINMKMGMCSNSDFTAFYSILLWVDFCKWTQNIVPAPYSYKCFCCHVRKTRRSPSFLLHWVLMPLNTLNVICWRTRI